MISSACHMKDDTQLIRAGAHPFLTGGQGRFDNHSRCAAGQPFNAGRAVVMPIPKKKAHALHPFHAAGHPAQDTQASCASGNLSNGRGHASSDTQKIIAAPTFYAVRPSRGRHPNNRRRAAPFHAVCGQRAGEPHGRFAANSTPLRRRANGHETPS